MWMSGINSPSAHRNATPRHYTDPQPEAHTAALGAAALVRARQGPAQPGQVRQAPAEPVQAVREQAQAAQEQVQLVPVQVAAPPEQVAQAQR